MKITTGIGASTCEQIIAATLKRQDEKFTCACCHILTFLHTMQVQ